MIWWVLGGEKNTRRDSNRNLKIYIYVGNAYDFVSMIPPCIGTTMNRCQMYLLFAGRGGYRYTAGFREDGGGGEMNI